MKITQKIIHLDETESLAVSLPIDYIAWERHTKQKVSHLANGAGMEDLLFLAWTTMTRTKETEMTFDEWAATVQDVEVLDADPKATKKAR